MKNNWKHSLAKLFLAGAALLLMSASSWAAPVACSGGGTGGTPPGLGAAALSALSLSSLVTEQAGTYSTGSNTGCYAEYIYSSTAAATLGDLTFVFYVGDASGAVENVSAYNFAGVTSVSSIGEVPDSLGGTAYCASSSPNIAAGAVNFNYNAACSDLITAGNNTEYLFIGTDVKTYQGGGNLAVTDGVTANIGDLQPGPEPSALLLWGTGLLGLAWTSRKKLGFGSSAV